MFNLDVKALADVSSKQIKTILSVLAFVVLIIIVVIVSKKVLKRLNTDTVVKNSDIDKKKLTLTETDYRQIVSILKASVKGYGTEEDAIYRALSRLGSKADWLKVVKEYGTDAEDFSLPARLIDELSVSEQKKVNDILSKFETSI